MVMKSDRKKHGSNEEIVEKCLKPKTIKRITKEIIHDGGICGKTRQSYTEVEKVVDTIGKYGALPKVKGIEISCSECGLVLDYKRHNGYLCFHKSLFHNCYRADRASVRGFFTFFVASFAAHMRFAVIA